MRNVTVIDYGVGNLYSVNSALEHCEASVTITSDHAAILSAERVVLPGVGAFANAMQELDARGLVPVIREVASRGVPLFGICLGMQLLLDESEEFGLTAGLGLIAGKVIAVPATTVDGAPQKIPHIGWSRLQPSAGGPDWASTHLRNTAPDDAAYFVHSFMAVPANPRHRFADCRYGGHLVPAVIGRDNVFGCQFHPERSGAVGLSILRAFCHA